MHPTWVSKLRFGRENARIFAPSVLLSFQKIFTVIGGPEGFNDKDTCFNNHWDPAFWERSGGRTINGADCVLRPGFVIGNTYLVFLGLQPTWRSFEKIETVGGRPNPDDRWLAFVTRRLAPWRDHPAR